MPQHRTLPPVILSSAFIADRIAPVVRDFVPDVHFVTIDPDGVQGDPATATIAYFSGDLLPDLGQSFAAAVDAATGLEWFQSFSAGIDHPWFQGIMARGVRMTTAAGAAAVPIAQTVAYYLLALTRDARRWEDARRRRAWEPHDIVDLAGASLVVVGMGPIGTEVAHLGQALHMEVTGVRRRPVGDEPCPTVAMDELDRLLPDTDYLVLAVPFTRDTWHLLDARRLALLPRHAVVVNVARGPLIDEPALVEALQEARLGGAALDVFEEEPLSPESPLWDMEHVIVTPHACGQTAGNDERALDLFVANLGRWSRGERLVNEVSLDDRASVVGS